MQYWLVVSGLLYVGVQDLGEGRGRSVWILDIGGGEGVCLVLLTTPLS